MRCRKELDIGAPVTRVGKSGSVGPLKRFREFVKKTAHSDSLPDYRISQDSGDDRVMFYSKNAKKLAQDSNELKKESLVSVQRAFVQWNGFSDMNIAWPRTKTQGDGTPDIETGYMGPKGAVSNMAHKSESYYLGDASQSIPSAVEGLRKRQVYLWSWITYRDVFPRMQVHVTEMCKQLSDVRLTSNDPNWKTVGDIPPADVRLEVQDCQSHNFVDAD